MSVRRVGSFAAVGALLLMSVGFFVTQRHTDIRSMSLKNSNVVSPAKKASYSIPVEATLGLTREPRLGEVVTLNYCLTPSEYVPEIRVSFDKLEGVEVVGGEAFLYTTISKGETRVFCVELKFLSSPVDIGVWAEGEAVLDDGSSRPVKSCGRLKRIIVDEEEGQFGSYKEWMNHSSRRVFMVYNHYEGNWMSEPDPAFYEVNRQIARVMRQHEHALTDSEALCLHADSYRLFINGVGSAQADDSERAKHLLDAGWLKKQRDGGSAKEVWLQDFMARNKGSWTGERQLNYHDQTNDSDYVHADVPAVTTTFEGNWKYLKHESNKDEGLLWETVETPVRDAEVWVLAYWFGHADRVYTGWDMTDSSGYYYITTDLIPETATQVRAYPIVCAWGPAHGTEMVKVSRPGSAPACTTKGDTTIWCLREAGNPLPDLVTPGQTFDFGVSYPETATSTMDQPRSGAINIYQVLLSAYDLCLPSDSGDSITSVRAMWKRGNLDATGYSNDTIYVSGDDSIQINTDEWDDGVIAHEYGHHVMAHFAEIPPGVQPIHYWWHYDLGHRNTAYPEGWAHFFGHLAIEDTYYVDAARGIGGDSVILWWNIENPWEHSDSAVHPFQGGAYCEGAVAGVLWDIYDFYSVGEVPYDTHPLLPAWPDTNLADTLTLGYDEIWKVFDIYNPPMDTPPPDTVNNCHTIHHFASGWRVQGHDHDVGTDHIFTHHRIEWIVGPGEPIRLNYKVDPVERIVALAWGPPDTVGGLPPAEGYCIYRKQPTDTAFSRIAARSDTFCSDSTVLADQIYVYTATAYDTSGYEGDTCANVTVWVPGSDDSLATARNNSQKIVWDQGDSTVYIAFSSGGDVRCEKSTDLGSTWLVETIGRGAYPTIALAPDGKLWMAWLGNPGKFGLSSSAWKSILYSTFSPLSAVWSQIDTIWTYGEDDSLQCVSFSADEEDPIGHGHIACTYVRRDSVGPPPGVVIDARLDYFRFQLGDTAAGVVRQEVANSSWGAPPPHIGLASIAADTAGLPHIGWEEYLSWKTNNPHAILYTRGTNILLDTVQWAMLEDTLSDTTKTSYHPFVAFDTLHDRTSVVWEAYNTAESDYQICSRFRASSWDTIRNVSDTIGDSRLSVTSDNFAVWCSWDSSGLAQIYKSEYSDFSSTWGSPETLFVSDEPSTYPHITHTSTEAFMMVCWTEGNSSPYSVAFDIQRDSSSGGHGLRSFYVDAGRPVASEHLLQRSGYRQWGNSPEVTVDTDPAKVSYGFGGLDPGLHYGLKTVHYFERADEVSLGTPMTKGRSSVEAKTRVGRDERFPQPEHTVIHDGTRNENASFAGNPVAQSQANIAPVGCAGTAADTCISRSRIVGIPHSAASRWIMAIQLDGQSSGTVDVSSKSVTAFQCEVPQVLTRDGMLILDISRLRGDYASVSEIYLYEARGARTRPVNTGPQLAAGTNRNRFRFHMLAPNPSRDGGTLVYELAVPSDIRVDVFDIAGRIVRTLSRPSLPPGTQEIRWGPAEDLDTQTLATGTYFVRLTARNATSGSEEFSSTRKLVLIR